MMIGAAAGCGTQRSVISLAAPRAFNCHFWIGAITNCPQSAGMHGALDDPLCIDNAYEAALELLPPSDWQRGRDQDTPAMKLAADWNTRVQASDAIEIARISGSRSSQSRRYPESRS